MTRKCCRLLLGLLLLGGCAYTPVRERVDGLVCDRASRPMDPAPAMPPSATTARDDSERNPSLHQVSVQEPATPIRPKTTLEKRLEVPPTLPGVEVPFIELPPYKTTPQAELDKSVDRFFPPLPSPGQNPTMQPGPEGRPLTLADLQKLAQTSSPLLRQAASDIEAAAGAVRQAGAYPNPTLGLTSQTHGPGGGPNYGGFVSQTVKTPGKLKLAQAAATMDWENAKLAYRRAETDLMAAVRTGYFAVLVAQENIRANQALVKLTDEMYKVMVIQLKGGQIATYEPMQMGVFAVQARTALVQARNSYTLAWKQLAAALGLPALPPTEVAGRIDLPLPLWRYDQALTHVLANHTDVQTARNAMDKARFNLRLAEITPYPDLSMTATVYNDVTPPGPNQLVASMNVGIPVPLFDRNQGAIRQAQGALVRAIEEPHRVRDDLTARVADAFRRYDESRNLVQLYVKEALPKQVQAFRAAVKRHYGGEAGVVAYTDLISAEQNLVAVVQTYITLLGQQWQAVVDLGSLLQVDDLFQVGERVEVPPVPDLEHLLELPCCHPCSPMPDKALRGVNGSWPPAAIAPSEMPRNVLPMPSKQGQAPTTGAFPEVPLGQLMDSAPVVRIPVAPAIVLPATLEGRTRPGA
jgi:cobalt-zinc-cadmium efflux system outer membrane protein